MSFTTPSTVLSGSVLPPSQWNSQVRDNISYLNTQLINYQSSISSFSGPIATLSGSVSIVYPQTMGTIVTNHTIGTADMHKLYKVNPSGGTITVSVGTAFPIGAKVDFVQTGSGTVLFSDDGVANLNSTPSAQLRTQRSVASIIKLSNTDWLLTGDLA
jgi:hypothetical protein